MEYFVDRIDLNKNIIVYEILVQITIVIFAALISGI